jgi:hypothetical protein
MTINISAPIGSEKVHDTANDADQHLGFVACPECSLPAAVQHWNQAESTDGPINLVKMTCVNRHWFLIPADRLNEHPQN